MRMRLAILALAALLSSTVAMRAQEKKDYLSDVEADKIREATTPSAKMVLFVTFADDRIAKLKYSLAHPTTDRRRAEQLNALINAYTGCIDDAADVIAVAKERQQDIKVGLKALTTRAKEDLAYLQELQKSGVEVDTYKETLDDAVEATQDALTDAEKAEKDISAPVRRKQ
jgi:lipid II:glycine glycyltransferase (peptidoglycan interpeptide bridge formation enzyme)